MESSSTTLSIAQYSDSFNSPSSGTDDNGASEMISSRTNEDNYTSDSFTSLTTDSIHTHSHISSHESGGGGAARARYYDHRGSSLERSKLTYDEDIFESASNESSNSLKDESSTEESLESSIEKEHQLQKKFFKTLVKKAKKNVAKASNAENDNNKLEPEAESNLLPEMHEYCHRKLHHLKNVNGKKLKSNDSLQCIKQDDHFQATLPITKRRLEEMKIENIRHRMKQKLDEVVEHDIKTCPVCMKAQEEITQKQFVGLKKTFLQSKLIEQRIQRHLEYKHSLDLIGELALPVYQSPAMIHNRFGAVC